MSQEDLTFFNITISGAPLQLFYIFMYWFIFRGNDASRVFIGQASVSRSATIETRSASPQAAGGFKGRRKFP